MLEQIEENPSPIKEKPVTASTKPKSNKAKRIKSAVSRPKPVSFQAKLDNPMFETKIQNRTTNNRSVRSPNKTKGSKKNRMKSNDINIGNKDSNQDEDLTGSPVKKGNFVSVFDKAPPKIPSLNYEVIGQRKDEVEKLESQVQNLTDLLHPKPRVSQTSEAQPPNETFWGNIYQTQEGYFNSSDGQSDNANR